MLFDSHVHTRRSVDSVMKPQDAIASAAAQGLGVIFTDHCDYISPSGYQPGDFDFDAYFAEYAPMRGDGVLVGVELGTNHLANEKNRAAVEKYPFDFIIASVHSVGMMESYDEFIDPASRRLTAAEYLEYNTRMAAEFTGFDAVGHINYPMRYVSQDDFDTRYGSNKEIYARLFEAVLDGGKVLELNTTKLEDAAFYQNTLDIYTAYGKAGGRYATLGSDAHDDPGLVGRNFALGLKLLGQAGLLPVCFRQRQMCFVG